MTYSGGPFHMNEQRQEDPLEPTHNSSLLIQDVALKTYQKRWTVEKGGGRGSERSVLMARHDDDDLWHINQCRWFMSNPLYTYVYEIYTWCNGYRRRNWTRRHEFKSWTGLIAFHIALIPLGKVWIQLFSLQLWVNSRADWFFSLGEATCLGEGKLWIKPC